MWKREIKILERMRFGFHKNELPISIHNSKIIIIIITIIMQTQ